jgi:hypothetical protein
MAKAEAIFVSKRDSDPAIEKGRAIMEAMAKELSESVTGQQNT